MNGSQFPNTGGGQIPSSPYSFLKQEAQQDLLTLIDGAQTLALKDGQRLGIAHVLMTAFHGPLAEPLGEVIPDNVRQAFYNAVSVYTTRVGSSPDLTDSLDYARQLARGRRMSAALMVYAIVAIYTIAQGLLIAAYTLGQRSADSLMDDLQAAAERSLTPMRLDESGPVNVIRMEPSQLRLEVQRLLGSQKLKAEQSYAFAHAHSPLLYNLATEVDMRPTRGMHIPLMRGPKGSGIERIAQALVEAPWAGLPFAWPFKDAYCLSVARLLARRDAYDILEMAVQEVGPTSLLVLTEAREFDRDAQHAQRAQDLVDFLHSEAPANVVLVYTTDDTGSLSETRLRRATFQDFTVEALLKTQTQQFVRDHFLKYWEVVDHVSVAVDAFEDVYPVSPYIFEDDLHFNLPYLPIVLGSNAARTVKGGKFAVEALVEAAKNRLEGARAATSRTSKAVYDAFARYFLTLQAEFDSLLMNPEPEARNGMPLVTRELVSAELAASAVYVFKWPEIQAMSRLAQIVPEPYPKP